MSDGLDGIRVEFRMHVSHEPDQRFDVNGNELLQIRGRVVDSDHVQPEVVVRFAGQQQAQLYRWARPGKHLSVVGKLEVKTWVDSAGRQQLALLIEARDIHPLGLAPEEVDHSREGVYAVMGRTSSELKPRASKADQVNRMRKLLDAG
jgi:hypothetical protein